MSQADELRAAADLAWASAQEAPADKRAPLLAQYRAALADLAKVADETKTGDPVDEIAQRRAARRAGTA